MYCLVLGSKFCEFLQRTTHTFSVVTNYVKNKMIHLIIAICMSLTIPLMSYLNRKTNSNPLSDFDELRMPKAYLFMGYLTVFISLGILIIPRLMEKPPEYYHPLIWVLIFSIFIFGIYIIRLYSVHKIEIKKDEFIVNSTFGQSQVFRVDKIKTLSINYLTYFITIKDEKGKKGKAYFHLIGLKLLLREIKTKSGRDTSKIERLLEI